MTILTDQPTIQLPRVADTPTIRFDRLPESLELRSMLRPVATEQVCPLPWCNGHSTLPQMPDDHGLEHEGQTTVIPVVSFNDAYGGDPWTVDNTIEVQVSRFDDLDPRGPRYGVTQVRLRADGESVWMAPEQALVVAEALAAVARAAMGVPAGRAS